MWVRLFVVVVGLGLVSGSWAAEYFPVCEGTVSGLSAGGGSRPGFCSVNWTWKVVEDLAKTDKVFRCGDSVGASVGAPGWGSASGVLYGACQYWTGPGTVVGTTYGGDPYRVGFGCFGVVSTGTVFGGLVARCTPSESGTATVRSLAVDRPDLYDLEAGWAMSALGLTSNELLSVLVIAVLVIIYIIGFGIGKQS